MKKISYLLLFYCLVIFAQENPKIEHSFSGYIDAFYSYNSHKPTGKTSLPFLYNYNRHNDFALNIALVRGTFTYKNTYAKISLQAGEYVTDNYASEPINVINEAYLGININPKTTFEIGILPSHIGFETATSHTNATLTRSILAENSPYFLSGIKLNHSFSEKLNFSVLLCNGWQHIEKLNKKILPALGTQFVYKPSAKTTLNLSSFLGDEPINNVFRTRFFNNFYIDNQHTTNFKTIIGFDYGLQKNKQNTFVNWFSPVFIGQYSITKKWQTACRIEYFDDKKNTIISEQNAIKLFSSSLNFDYLVNPKAKIRTEIRWLNTAEKLMSMPTNTFLYTTSFSFEF